jgi:tetrapyrrole methylase family protein/MazG family protein
METFRNNRRVNGRKNLKNLENLIEVVKDLRAPGGCPWDMEQTHMSCKGGLIEEAYEAVDAIEKEDYSLLKEELGDVLLQVVFHSQIAEEAGKFDFTDVCNDVTEKLIQRHPHVFGDVEVENSNEVLENWDKNKKENKNQNFSDTLKDVPNTFPALLKAQKVLKRADKAPFYNLTTENVINNLSEFTEVLKTAENGYNISNAYGKLLLNTVALGYLLKLDAEDVLQQTVNDFVVDFKNTENVNS